MGSVGEMSGNFFLSILCWGVGEGPAKYGHFPYFHFFMTSSLTQLVSHKGTRTHIGQAKTARKLNKQINNFYVFKGMQALKICLNAFQKTKVTLS